MGQRCHVQDVAGFINISDGPMDFSWSLSFKATFAQVALGGMAGFNVSLQFNQLIVIQRGNPSVRALQRVVRQTHMITCTPILHRNLLSFIGDCQCFLPQSIFQTMM